MIILKGRVVLPAANHSDDGVCQSSPTKLDAAIWVFCLHETVSASVCVCVHTCSHACVDAHMRCGRADWRTAYHTPMIPRCAHGNERMLRWLDDWLEAPTNFSASTDKINISWRQRWGKFLQLLFDVTIFCSWSSFSHWNFDVYVLNLQTFCLRLRNGLRV